MRNGSRTSESASPRTLVSPLASVLRTRRADVPSRGMRPTIGAPMAPAAPPTFAVLGQGSIGRRHAGLLAELDVPLVVFDPVGPVEPPPGARVAGTEEEAIEAADAVVLAS